MFIHKHKGIQSERLGQFARVRKVQIIDVSADLQRPLYPCVRS